MLATHHDKWHNVFGKYALCEQGCDAIEVLKQRFREDALAVAKIGSRRISCSSCNSAHSSEEMVNFCYEVKAETEKARRQLDFINNALKDFDGLLK